MMETPKKATWARDGRKKGPNVISFAVKAPKEPTWDDDLGCKLLVPTEKAYNVRPAFTRGWVNTAWSWGDVKVHIDDWVEPDSDNGGNGYEGDMMVTVYKLRQGQWVQVNDITRYYHYERNNITLGDVFRALGLEPVSEE